MADKPHARIDAKVLPSPGGGEPEHRQGGFFSNLIRKATEPKPSPDHQVALAAIAALRECTACLTSESGAGRAIMWNDAVVSDSTLHGLNHLTRQGWETRPYAKPLQQLLNVASFLDNMNLNYSHPQGSPPIPLHLEEQRLLRPTTELSAVRDVMAYGTKWLQTARASLADIRTALDLCYQELNVPNAKALDTSHPLHRIVIESEKTYDQLQEALEATNEPMKALGDHIATLPPEAGRRV